MICQLEIHNGNEGNGGNEQLAKREVSEQKPDRPETKAMTTALQRCVGETPYFHQNWCT